jgi:hypothetical protein
MCSIKTGIKGYYFMMSLKNKKLTKYVIPTEAIKVYGI